MKYISYKTKKLTHFTSKSKRNTKETLSRRPWQHFVNKYIFFFVKKFKLI